MIREVRGKGLIVVGIEFGRPRSLGTFRAAWSILVEAVSAGLFCQLIHDPALPNITRILVQVAGHAKPHSKTPACALTLSEQDCDWIEARFKRGNCREPSRSRGPFGHLG